MLEGLFLKRGRQVGGSVSERNTDVLGGLCLSMFLYCNDSLRFPSLKDEKQRGKEEGLCSNKGSSARAWFHYLLA